LTTHVLILVTPMEDVLWESFGERYCFSCRTRREFERIVSLPVVTSPDDSGAWYGPSVRIECATCRTVDGDVFPGRVRDWA
jgi:hypothetical protein